MAQILQSLKKRRSSYSPFTLLYVQIPFMKGHFSAEFQYTVASILHWLRAHM